MRLVLSPYDLVSPSAASAMALMLASDDGGVVTLAPLPLEPSTPARGRDSLQRAPGLLQVLEKWRWTTPLWRSGLLRADSDGATPLDDIRSVCAGIEADPQAGHLRAIGGADLFADPDSYLDALSRDLLRGGGNPAVSIPLIAGLERFAARHGLPLVRQMGASLAARFDRRAGIPLARFTVPLPVGAAPTAILAARFRLSNQLASIRSTLEAIIALPAEESATSSLRLSAGCEVFAKELGECARAVLDESAREGEPARIAEVACTVSMAPVGAFLESASKAVATLAPPPPARARKGRGPPVEQAGAAADRAALGRPRMPVLTVRTAPWDTPGPS